MHPIFVSAENKPKDNKKKKKKKGKIGRKCKALTFLYQIVDNLYIKKIKPLTDQN
jgi:hypothetical protein